jgi:hypothetical protein
MYIMSCTVLVGALNARQKSSEGKSGGPIAEEFQINYCKLLYGTVQ